MKYTIPSQFVVSEPSRVNQTTIMLKDVITKQPIKEEVEIKKVRKKKKVEWDEIEPRDMKRLVERVEKFYENKKGLTAIRLADIFIKRLRADQDFWVNTEGTKGKGKSNLVLLLALLMCRYCGTYRHKKTGKLIKTLPRTNPLSNDWEMIECGFKFNRNMSFLDTPEEVKKKYKDLDRYHPFIIDEGSKNLHKQRWQDKTQFMLVQMSDTERWQNKGAFVCLPNFQELNSTFRNDRIMMRLYLYARSTEKKRSSCIISIKDINRHIRDPWFIDENAKTFEEVLKKIPPAFRGPEDILKAESRLKGFAGNFDVPSLKHISPKIWKIYMAYKISNAEKELDNEHDDPIVKKYETKLLTQRKTLWNAIEFIKRSLPGSTVQDVVSAIGISRNEFNKLREEFKPKHTITYQE